MVSTRIIFIDNIINIICSITSLVLLEIYYKTDSREIDNYEIVLMYHIICYINTFLFFILSMFIKSTLFYVSWKVCIYYIQLAMYIMTFIQLGYILKYPTYIFETFHTHIYTLLFLGFSIYKCLTSFLTFTHVVVEYDTENSYFPLRIEKNGNIPETNFPIQTCGFCNRLNHLFILNCGHTLCETCGKSKRIGKVCPYCGKEFSIMKRIYF